MFCVSLFCIPDFFASRPHQPRLPHPCHITPPFFPSQCTTHFAPCSHKFVLHKCFSFHFVIMIIIMCQIQTHHLLLHSDPTTPYALLGNKMHDVRCPLISQMLTVIISMILVNISHLNAISLLNSHIPLQIFNFVIPCDVSCLIYIPKLIN